MSEENVEIAGRSYAALNAAYAKGDVDDLLPLAEEHYHPGFVLKTSGMFPETAEMHGHDGLLQFEATQMEAFTRMWIEPQEFIGAGDIVIVLVRFGGRARHSGIEVEFSVVHVFTIREGKTVRIEMYETKAEALEAAGLRE